MNTEELLSKMDEAVEKFYIPKKPHVMAIAVSPKMYNYFLTLPESKLEPDNKLVYKSLRVHSKKVLRGKEYVFYYSDGKKEFVKENGTVFTIPSLPDPFIPFRLDMK